MINMAILDSGSKIKKTEEAHIYIRTDKDMRVVGLKIKNKEKASINIEMVMYMRVVGRMIEDKDKEQ